MEGSTQARKQNMTDMTFGTPAYGLTRTLPEATFADAVAAVTEAMKAEGFGLLTEIDVRATFDKKLGVAWPNYKILGMCNPKLAHEALTAEAGIGLLLPCNVVVAETPGEGVVVSAIDPAAMFQVVDMPGIGALAEDVRGRLQRALDALK
jgi:uncharacterized protein (DUF302 family)